MPTIWVKHDPTKELDPILDQLAEDLPGIAAPLMNVSGSELHQGGVGEAEIMVEFLEFSPRDRNVNHIQITMIAHPFPERQAQLDTSTAKLKSGVMALLADFDRNVTVGVSIWLVEMGYETIGKEA